MLLLSSFHSTTLMYNKQIYNTTDVEMGGIPIDVPPTQVNGFGHPQAVAPEQEDQQTIEKVKRTPFPAARSEVTLLLINFVTS